MPRLFGSCIGGKSSKRKDGEASKKPKKSKSKAKKKGGKIDELDGGVGPWEGIVTKSMVGTGIMKDGAIVDKEGKVYGFSDNFHLKKKQIHAIAVAIYEDPSLTKIPTDGIKLGTQTFKYELSEPGDWMVGNAPEGEGGVIIRCSDKFIIIGVYDSLAKQNGAKDLMVDLQRYFKKQGL